MAVIRIVCACCGELHEVGEIECRCGAVYNVLTGDPIDLLPDLEHQAPAPACYDLAPASASATALSQRHLRSPVRARR